MLLLQGLGFDFRKLIRQTGNGDRPALLARERIDRPQPTRSTKNQHGVACHRTGPIGQRGFVREIVQPLARTRGTASPRVSAHT